ncbi:MAG: ATP-dependent zinc protease [Parvibaculaceae bacterium]
MTVRRGSRRSPDAMKPDKFRRDLNPTPALPRMLKRAAKEPRPKPALVGWREYVSLPELGLGPVKAKIDTGALWCALHAEEIEIEGERVRFRVSVPGRRFRCAAHIVDRKRIRSSSGHSEERLVIETVVALGPHRFPAKITLTDRTDMLAPMLLGRDSIGGRFLVDPGRALVLTGSKKKKRKASRP